MYDFSKMKFGDVNLQLYDWKAGGLLYLKENIVDEHLIHRFNLHSEYSDWKNQLDIKIRLSVNSWQSENEPDKVIISFEIADGRRMGRMVLPRDQAKQLKDILELVLEKTDK